MYAQHDGYRRMNIPLALWLLYFKKKDKKKERKKEKKTKLRFIYASLHKMHDELLVVLIQYFFGELL